MLALERYDRLIADAARLYERHRRRGPPAFNLFPVLRQPTDEVNLHSRFLHALLDHVDPRSGRKENLAAFVGDVAGGKQFDFEGARVEREADHIDLLISNGYQAVVVENKIHAGDQERQLERYCDSLLAQGYEDRAILLLYLTLDGHEPGEQSLGKLSADRVKLVSYGGHELQDWLTGCQRRAFDQPTLRESIAQYLDLIRRMTNTHYEDEHMLELKELLLKADNLVLAGQISRALPDAHASAMASFYRLVDDALREEIDDLPEVDPKWERISKEPAIQRSIRSARQSQSGLYYGIAGMPGAWLGVSAYDRLWFGVECAVDKHAKLHGELVESLDQVGGSHHTANWAPWWRYVDELPTWPYPGEWFHLRGANDRCLEFLSPENEAAQQELARDIARTARILWGAIKA